MFSFKKHFYFGVAIAVLLLFQNCAKFEITEESVSSKAENLPVSSSGTSNDNVLPVKVPIPVDNPNSAQVTNPSTPTQTTPTNLGTGSVGTGTVVKIIYGTTDKQRNFGFFWLDASIADQVPSYVDFIVSPTDSASLTRVTSKQLKILALPNSFVTIGADGKIKLYSDYKERWMAERERLKSYENNILGFYPIDEPYWNALIKGNTPAEMTTILDTISKTIKTDFPTKLLYFVEAYPMIDQNMIIPQYFDVYGFDCYDGWEVCGSTTSLRPNFKPQSFETMYNILKSKVVALNQKDGGNRRMILIPPSAVIQNINNPVAQAELENKLRGLMDKYIQLSLADNMVYTVIGFLWGSLTEGTTQFVGFKDLTKSTQAKYHYFSNVLKNISSKIRPVSVKAGVTSVDSNINNIIDNIYTSSWNAGTYPNKDTWIELDLGREVTVQSLFLLVNQLPEGQTTHEIWGGPTSSEAAMVRLDVLSGYTKVGDLLVSKSPSLSGYERVRYLRVKTTNSPSWVSWVEVVVEGI